MAGGESVTLDLDGGGPLKAFQVLCAYVEADSRRQVAKKSAARASTKSSIDSREGSASWEDMSSNGEGEFINSRGLKKAQKGQIMVELRQNKG